MDSLASLAVIFLTIGPVLLHAAGVCHPPPDPGVSFPLYNRLLTIRLPLLRDAATRQLVAAKSSDALKTFGLREIRQLLAAVSKMWVHDATSVALESNGTQLALQDLVIELNSPADSDHCSHVFQQYLFIAAQSNTAETHFDIRQFSDIKVEYHHLFGACQPGRQQTAHFYGALRLDKADADCRGLASVKDTKGSAVGLPTDLYQLVDRLFFMPSSRYNSTAIDGSLATNDRALPPILLQSNNHLMAFIIDFRLTVDRPAEDWPRLGAEVIERYENLSRLSDDYGIQRQGAAPSCLNYLNFASPPATQLASSCGTCFDISVLVSVNISLSQSTDIRPLQCETVSSVRTDNSWLVLETKAILASLANSSVTSHLFQPLPNSSAYFDILSVSCSAEPKHLIADLSLRLRALHSALLRYPLVLRAGLQRNINAYLSSRHLGLANVRAKIVSNNNTDCGGVKPPVFDNYLSVLTAMCSNGTAAAAGKTVNILRHSFQLRLSGQSLLSQVPSARPDLTTGLVRFFLTAALSGIDLDYRLLAHSLYINATRRSAAADASALIDVEAAYATGGRLINATEFNAKFRQAITGLQSDFGPVTALNSNMTPDKFNCSDLTVSTANAQVTQPAPVTTAAPVTLTTKAPETTAGLDSNHALELNFTVSSKLLYGGRIGDYLVTSGLNAALQRAGLRDIQDVDLIARDCRDGPSCQITARVLCGNHSVGNASSTAGVHYIPLATLLARLSPDPLLRPANIKAGIVRSRSPQEIPASSIIYRYATSPYFNRPPPSMTGGVVSQVRLTIMWRLVSVNVSAPLAYRSLPSDPPTSESDPLRYLLEQLLVDLLGARLLSWPRVTAYKSDSGFGRIDAAVDLDRSAVGSLSAEVSASADRFPLAGFIRLSDLRVQPVRNGPAAAAASAYDSCLMLQTYYVYKFVSNATLQSMPESDLQRQLSRKLRFVQSAIFNGQAGRPELLSFEYLAQRRPDASIRVDALSRITWPTGTTAAASFNEDTLKKLIDTELEALHNNVDVIPMTIDSRQTILRLLDSQAGLADFPTCELLLQFRPAPNDIAVAAVDASWLPVADRLTASLGGNASRVSVLSLSPDPASNINALVTVPRKNSCSETAQLLLKASTSSSANNRLVAARSISDNVLTALDSVLNNQKVLVRHIALLPSYHSLSKPTDNADSLGDYFCFLTMWAHSLFNSNRGSGVCVSNLAEPHRVRLNPLSDVTTPAMRLSTVSAFTDTPPNGVMQLFWRLKNFYLTSNETFIDLYSTGAHNATGGDFYVSLITSQLPPPPPHPMANITTMRPATVAVTLTTPASTAFATATRAMPATASAATAAPNVSVPTSVAPPTSVKTPTTAQPPTSPVGPYYIAADRMASLVISLGIPADPRQGRYFYSDSALLHYLMKSALAQSLLKSAWQVAPDDILSTRVSVDTSQLTVSVFIELLLTVDRNSANLESELRTVVDQSMLLSTVFSKRTYSASFANLPARRWLHRTPSAATGSTLRQSVEHRMLVRLTDGAPDFLRIRDSATYSSDTRSNDLLLDFLMQQLVIDASRPHQLISRPQLVQYKSDSHLAWLHLRYEIQQPASLQQLTTDFAASWQRLDSTAQLRDILYLDIRAVPPQQNRGLLLYQMLRLESYISKKSLMSLPSEFLALTLEPKIKYVMQKVFPSGSASTPGYLDVEVTFAKNNGALDILALTRVSIPPGYSLYKLQQRIQLHVKQRLEELANDVTVVPSFFNNGRTDVRVLDLKEDLSHPYWCDLVYTFAIDGTSLPSQAFQLAAYLSQLISPKLPRHTQLERLAVLQSIPSAGSAPKQLEVQALVTLSSAHSLPFAEATSILTKAASSEPRLTTRAVVKPFNSAPSLVPRPSSTNSISLNHTVTFVGSADSLTQPDADKISNYACFLYQSALESAHWFALYVVPHSCSATTAVSSIQISRQPLLSLPALQLNISARVASQTENADISASAIRAVIGALNVKNFYFNSGEIVLSNEVQLHTAGHANSTTRPPPPTRSSGTTAGPAAILYYNLLLQFPLSNITSDYLAEPDNPMALLLAQSLLRSSLSANAALSKLANHLTVVNASRLADFSLSSTAAINVTGGLFNMTSELGFGLVLARFAPASAVASSDQLRAAVADSIASWPLAALLFTKRPYVIALPEFEQSPTQLANPTTPAPSSASGTKPNAVKTRRRRSASAAAGSNAAFVEHRLQLFATASLPIFLRFRDIPLRPDPLLAFLTEQLLNLAMRRWAETNGRNGSISADWPKLMWLRSDNSSVTLCIRYPLPAGVTQQFMMDSFASAWVSVNRELAGCSLCMARDQDIRLIASSDAFNETVGLLVYHRLQFDGFVGKDTMRKLNHDDLNQLMRHRLQFILGRLYPGGGGGNLSLAGFDFECYGRNSTVVTFLLARLLSSADVQEAAIRRHAIAQLRGLVNDEHVLPAQLANNGTDLRILAKRTGLPAGTVDWLDIQATFEYAEDSVGSLHGYALAAGARRHLKHLLGRAARPISIAQLRLMRWKRLGTGAFGQHHQLVTVLATLSSKSPPSRGEAATPQDLRAELGKATGLLEQNLTLPLQDFDHEPRHYDQHHLDLMHTGVALQQPVYLVDSGRVDDSSLESTDQLTSDFLCLLLASAFRQRGSARLRFVDDSCAARVTSRGSMSPHPLSFRRIPATTATAYFTLHNSSQPYNPAEAADTIDQLANSLNAYADVPGRTFATGEVSPILPVPIYQLLKFGSAGFPQDLSNSSSKLYLDSSGAIKRSLALYLRSVAHLFSGQVKDIRFYSGSILVFINYRIYPRLFSPSQVAIHIEQHTEALFSTDSPFHGLQLDRDGSFTSTAPIAEGREPKLDRIEQPGVPVAIYCILGVASFLLLLLSSLLIVRLIRIRRNNRIRARPLQQQGSTNSQRRSLKCAEEGNASQVRPAPANTVRIEISNADANANSRRTSRISTVAAAGSRSRLPSTDVPRLPQPPESRRASSATNRRASAVAPSNVVMGSTLVESALVAPVSAPNEAPNAAPTAAPGEAPGAAPNEAPTAAPTAAPTTGPNDAQNAAPNVAPNDAPNAAPSGSLV